MIPGMTTTFNTVSLGDFSTLYEFPSHVDWRFNFEFLVDCVGYTHLFARDGLLHHSCLRTEHGVLGSG